MWPCCRSARPSNASTSARPKNRSDAWQQNGQRMRDTQKASAVTTGSGPDRVAPALDASSSGADIDRIVRTEVESERWLHDLIDSLPAAIYTTDAGGRLTHFNQAAVAFSGRVPELGTDRWCISWKLYHPDGRPMPHDECPMAIALKENRIVRGADVIVERPDGTRIWCAPYPTPLRDATGRVIGGVNMLID